MKTNPSAAASKLALHKNSYAVSKLKPKIRIIHIVAPEIIKTDVANFRQLVQRLTGRSSSAASDKKPGSPQETSSTNTTSSEEVVICSAEAAGKNSIASAESDRIGMRNPEKPEIRMKKESLQEIWKGDEINSSNGYSNYMCGFGDMDRLIQDLQPDYPLLPLSSTSHFNMYEGLPLCQ
ncbi:VQ motif-containing protein 25-like [Diospyros lotus]|uniref:VQ motif-containing protein 25-like n=1 Tax=Diospyros lotus TaxID=55363 RepID=UPI00225A4193|nr:VQ motif-containing protein 25-like [Diospyros lotus]